MASFHCLIAFLSFAVVGAGHAGAKDAEHLICTKKGNAFQMDNGMYWSSKPEGILGQVERDYTCDFQVCMLGAGKVLITDYKNKYLTLANDGSNRINTVKNIAKPNSEFVLRYVDGKMEFMAANNLFFSRIYYVPSETHTLEAQKKETDHFTPFTLVTC